MLDELKALADGNRGSEGQVNLSRRHAEFLNGHGANINLQTEGPLLVQAKTLCECVDCACQPEPVEAPEPKDETKEPDKKPAKEPAKAKDKPAGK